MNCPVGIFRRSSYQFINIINIKCINFMSRDLRWLTFNRAIPKPLIKRKGHTSRKRIKGTVVPICNLRLLLK